MFDRPKPRKLTARQARFVAEYMVDLNATQAAMRAGYSAKTAEWQGPQLLRKAHVAAAIVARQAKLADKLEIKAEQVLRELAAIGFADMGTYLKLGTDGTVTLDWSKLPEGATRIIAEIVQEERTEGRGENAVPIRRTKFKLYSKLEALVQLGKHLGMFGDGKAKGGGAGAEPADFLPLEARLAQYAREDQVAAAGENVVVLKGRGKAPDGRDRQ